MEDEKKAREIAIKIEKGSSFLSGFGKKEIVVEELKNAAIEMAEWKTQQAIERVTELLNGCGDYWYVSKDSDGDAVLDRYSLLKDIIQVLKED